MIVFNRLPAVLAPATLALAGSLSVPAGTAATLSPAAIAGWNAYVAATEQRIARELASAGRFLVQDFQADAEANRRAVLSGETVIEELEARDARGGELTVPDAMVHHWRGATLVRGARLDDLLRRLQTGVPAANREDVLASRVLDRAPHGMRVFLRLQRRKFVTVVYNTEHEVVFRRHSPTRATSTSTAVRIAEVESPGTSSERELPPGQDRGFLWRLNAYWRYEQVPGGVIVECESLTLSREVPFGLRTIAGPLIASAARESLDRVLGSYLFSTDWR
jgi:hypothetical protein